MNDTQPAPEITDWVVQMSQVGLLLFGAMVALLVVYGMWRATNAIVGLLVACRTPAVGWFNSQMELADSLKVTTETLASNQERANKLLEQLADNGTAQTEAMKSNADALKALATDKKEDAKYAAKEMRDKLG